MKKFERCPDNRVLFGVCGGLAEYLGLDANLVRVLWIASVLFGGVGLLPYIAAIFLVPERETLAPREERAPSGGTKVLGLVLIGLAGVLFLRGFGFDFGPRVFAFWTFGILLPLVLLVAGVLLVWPRFRESLGFSGPTRPRRSVSDRVLAGVAGGLAREMGMDANLVRLGFVLMATVTSGFFILVYFLLLFVMPEEEIVGRPAGGPVPSPPAGPADGPAAPADRPPASGASASPEGAETAPTAPAPDERETPPEAPPAPEKPSEDVSEGSGEDQGSREGGR